MEEEELHGGSQASRWLVLERDLLTGEYLRQESLLLFELLLETLDVRHDLRWIGVRSFARFLRLWLAVIIWKFCWSRFTRLCLALLVLVLVLPLARLLRLDVTGFLLRPTWSGLVLSSLGSKNIVKFVAEIVQEATVEEGWLGRIACLRLEVAGRRGSRLWRFPFFRSGLLDWSSGERGVSLDLLR